MDLIDSIKRHSVADTSQRVLSSLNHFHSAIFIELATNYCLEQLYAVPGTTKLKDVYRFNYKQRSKLFRCLWII